MMSLTLDQVKICLAKNPIGYFKYVRIGDEFRFSVVTAGGLTHIELQGPDKASGAGFLAAGANGMFIDGNSSTLKIGPGQGDEELLSELLGLPIKERW